MTFKEKIVKLRKLKGLTQDEFASAVGVSRQAVYKWESGQSYPEVAKLLEMKALFNISIDDLLEDNYEVIVPEKKKRKRLPKEIKREIEEKIEESVVYEEKAEEISRIEEEPEIKEPSMATAVKEEAAEEASSFEKESVFLEEEEKEAEEKEPASIESLEAGSAFIRLALCILAF